MFSREITVSLRDDGKYKLEWKVAEGFYNTLILSSSELEKIISQYRQIKE